MSYTKVMKGSLNCQLFIRELIRLDFLNVAIQSFWVFAWKCYQLLGLAYFLAVDNRVERLITKKAGPLEVNIFRHAGMAVEPPDEPGGQEKGWVLARAP